MSLAKESKPLFRVLVDITAAKAIIRHLRRHLYAGYELVYTGLMVILSLPIAASIGRALLDFTYPFRSGGESMGRWAIASHAVLNKDYPARWMSALGMFAAGAGRGVARGCLLDLGSLGTWTLDIRRLDDAAEICRMQDELALADVAENTGYSFIRRGRRVLKDWVDTRNHTHAVSTAELGRALLLVNDAMPAQLSMVDRISLLVGLTGMILAAVDSNAAQTQATLDDLTLRGRALGSFTFSLRRDDAVLVTADDKAGPFVHGEDAVKLLEAGGAQRLTMAVPGKTS